MTGERLLWFQIASHLQLPVAELRERITFSEFLEWEDFIIQEEQRRTKLDFYLAQIAAEIRRSWVASGEKKKVKISSFYLPLPTEPTSPQARMERSKAAWAAHAGIDLNKVQQKTRKKK